MTPPAIKTTRRKAPSSVRWGPWYGYTNPDGSRFRYRFLMCDGKPVRKDSDRIPPKCRRIVGGGKGRVRK